MKSLLPGRIVAATATVFFIGLKGFAGNGCAEPVNNPVKAVDTTLPAKQGKRVKSFSRQPAEPVEASMNLTYSSVAERSDALKKWAATAHCDTGYAICINLGMPAAKKRCFIIDLGTSTVINYGVAVADSARAVAYRGVFLAAKQSAMGSFRLQPLTPLTRNSRDHANAAIIVQSSGQVEGDQKNISLPVGEGFSLSPAFFASLHQTMHSARKPVLFWIY